MDDETPSGPDEAWPTLPKPDVPIDDSPRTEPEALTTTRRWQTWHVAVIAAVALLVGTGVGSAISSGKTKTASASTDTTIDTTPITTDTIPDTIPDTTQPPTPTIKDFKIVLRVIDSSCFDTAGANVTVEPDVTYTGPDLTGHSWELTYVIGGGDQTDTHTIDGTGTQFPADRQTVSTPTCHDTLTALPTNVVVR